MTYKNKIQYIHSDEFLKSLHHSAKTPTSSSQSSALIERRLNSPQLNRNSSFSSFFPFRVSPTKQKGSRRCARLKRTRVRRNEKGKREGHASRRRPTRLYAKTSLQGGSVTRRIIHLLSTGWCPASRFDRLHCRSSLL